MVNRVAVVGAIQAALLADAALTELLGDRIYLLEAPSDSDEPVTPYMVTERIKTRPFHTDDEGDGVFMTLTLTIWGSKDAGPAVVTAAGDAARDVLNCWSDDALKVLANTRRTDSDVNISGSAYYDQSTYRFQIGA